MSSKTSVSLNDWLELEFELLLLPKRKTTQIENTLVLKKEVTRLYFKIKIKYIILMHNKEIIITKIQKLRDKINLNVFKNNRIRNMKKYTKLFKM